MGRLHKCLCIIYGSLSASSPEGKGAASVTVGSSVPELGFAASFGLYWAAIPSCLGASY